MYITKYDILLQIHDTFRKNMKSCAISCFYITCDINSQVPQKLLQGVYGLAHDASIWNSLRTLSNLGGGLNIFRLARPINLRDHETKLITYEWGKTSAMYHFSTHKTFLSFEFCSGSLVISCPSPSARVREITLEPLQNSQDKNNLFVEKWYIASVFTPLIGKWLVSQRCVNTTTVCGKKPVRRK